MNEPFQSINEVSRALGLPAHTLRYWEREFPAAVRPVTGAGGRRYYRADTVASLSRIKELLYGQGYTIAGVRKLLSSGKLEDAENREPKAENRNPRDGALRAQSGKTAKHESSADSPEIQQAMDLLNMARAALS
ncbi:MAG: MerR family transcriptional regulator [Proteobacteria bacterium]|nr:MerR family transcriptional regulator [Pseudomonadota bacterium]